MYRVLTMGTHCEAAMQMMGGMGGRGGMGGMGAPGYGGPGAPGAGWTIERELEYIYTCIFHFN